MLASFSIRVVILLLLALCGCWHNASEQRSEQVLLVRRNQIERSIKAASQELLTAIKFSGNRDYAAAIVDPLDSEWRVISVSLSTGRQQSRQFPKNSPRSFFIDASGSIRTESELLAQIGVPSRATVYVDQDAQFAAFSQYDKVVGSRVISLCRLDDARDSAPTPIYVDLSAGMPAGIFTTRDGIYLYHLRTRQWHPLLPIFEAKKIATVTHDGAFVASNDGSVMRGHGFFEDADGSGDTVILSGRSGLTNIGMRQLTLLSTTSGKSVSRAINIDTRLVVGSWRKN